MFGLLSLIYIGVGEYLQFVFVKEEPSDTEHDAGNRSWEFFEW